MDVLGKEHRIILSNHLLSKGETLDLKMNSFALGFLIL